MNNYPVYPSGDKFITDDLGVLTAPRVKKPHKLLATPEKYEQKYMTPRNSELKANALLWADRYSKLLNALPKSERGSKLESYLQEQLNISQRIISTEN